MGRRSKENFSIRKQISTLFYSLFIAFSVVLLVFFGIFSWRSISEAFEAHDRSAREVAESVELSLNDSYIELNSLCSDVGNLISMTSDQVYDRSILSDAIGERIRTSIRSSDIYDAIFVVERNSDIVVETHKNSEASFRSMLELFNGYSSILPNHKSFYSQANLIFANPIVTYGTVDRMTRIPAYGFLVCNLDKILPETDCVLCCLCTVDDGTYKVVDSVGSLASKYSEHRFKFEEVSESVMFIEGRLCLGSVSKVDSANLFVLYFSPFNGFVLSILKVFIYGLILASAIFIFGVRGMRTVRIRLMNPLKSIVDDTNYIRRGEYSHRIKASDSQEFLEISESFNKLLDEMDERNSLVLKQQKQLYELAIQTRESQLMGLQSQINPHFLYNTLECIRSISRFHNIDEISQIVDGMSDIYRYSASSEPGTVSSEFRCLKSYIGVLDVRFERKYKFSLTMDKGVSNLHMPKLLLQPLVENAVNHGLFFINREGKVRVKAQISKGLLKIVVSDNGVGIEPDKLEQIRAKLEVGQMTEHNSRNIGLANVHMRIAKEFGSEYGLSIDSEYAVGTSVTLTMPAVEVKQ